MIYDLLDRTLAKRIFAHLVIDESGCLLWRGSCDSDGYGHVWFDGRLHQVHRVVWQIAEGAIPEDLELDHVRDLGCRNRNCASISHLEPVTHRENMMRGAGIGSENAAKTHCGTCGSPFDKANTYIMPNGHRDCRTCIRARARRYQARKRARTQRALEAS